LKINHPNRKNNVTEPQEPTAEPTAESPSAYEIRLDKLVAEKFQLSRRTAQEAILNGKVDVEGFRCHEPGRMLTPEAQVHFDVNRPKARRVIDSPINVLFEDQYFVVLQKPPGVATTPSGDWEKDTMVSRVERYFAIRHGGQNPYVGVVHRLDMDTSGVMIFAKSPEVTRRLQETWRAHDIGREYLSIVMDKPARDQVICRRDVVETGERRRRLARPDETGQSAVTHVELVEVLSRRGSLVRCIPETGRTHQIRLHLNSIGCPVFGDQLYGRPARNDQVQPPRLCLHAARLHFQHPMTGEKMEFDTQLPDDMAHFAEKLARHEKKQDRERARRKPDDNKS
jgi:23S rRNA pseudouridine1911/1915/1917 synthase